MKKGFVSIKNKHLSLINNEFKLNNLKFYFLLYKKFYNRKVRNYYCFKTKRMKGFYRFFNLSRQTIKEFAKKEFLPGIAKGSW